ncbi:MAG: hypothetical protein JSS49_19600 [Planctomycetes bacterium]|nr:hypothetical protein [Planctomycetota bacterium]
MPRRRYLPGILLLVHLGCAHQPIQTAAPVVPAPYQQFVSQKFDWSTVKRVVLMPMSNNTAFAQASVEMQNNLAAELQRAGRFDVVVATHEDPGARARDVFSRGTFDELELLRIAREYDAQAVLFGQLTQYHPYPPPKVGLTLLMISPAEGVAIASADGLWDAREITTAQQAQGYLHEKLTWRQSLMGVDRALESPDVYQRFVCQQIATSLQPAQGILLPPPPLNALPSDVMSAGYTAPAESSSPSHRINPFTRTKAQSR